MTELPEFEELTDLVWTLANDRLEGTGLSRLRQLLSQDRAYVRAYLKLLDQFAALEWERGEDRPRKTSGTPNQLPFLPTVDQPSLPIVLDLSPPLQQSARPFFLGTTLFCYAVSAVVVLLGLLIARFSIVPLEQPTARNSLQVPPPVEGTEALPQFVAQITGMVDCQLIAPASEMTAGTHLALGQRLELQSGLLEITYASGARVILDGRTRYQVDTRNSGYLSLGKLAARVETKPEDLKGHIRHSLPAAAFASHLDSALFAVRTPSSIVTDLGTEFGVEVDESGASEAHVFQGKIEVRSAQSRNEASVQTVTLLKDQSARVAATPSAPVVVGHTVAMDRFIRRLPKRVRLNLFNTGIGVKEGENDPHWQVVARNDDPNFTPQTAVVLTIPVQHQPGDPPGVGHLYMLPNDPARSQWISLRRDGDQPGGVTFTFRTTFELADVLPGTAALRGRFIVDDHISTIRLNGRKLPVPPHDWTWVFFTWSEFQATSGFIEGTNVLEVDVYNGRESGSPSSDRSDMSLRLELEGTALPRLESSPTSTVPANSMRKGS